jgi:16S rRNA (guanine527-N7)-methyltransferase
MKEEIIKKAAEVSVLLSEKQADQFVRYYEMLIEKNKVMNLTAITECFVVMN